MLLSTPLIEIKGVGKLVATKLKVLGLSTVGDLVVNFPRRYEDYSQVQEIMSIKPGSEVTVRGKINAIAGRYVRRGMHITECVVSDKSGSMKIVWFNQPYRANSTRQGQEYYISGKFELSRGRLNIVNPSMELVSEFPVNTARILPIYRETKGIKSATIRKLLTSISPVLDSLPETLPEKVVANAKLISYAKAVKYLHFPKSPHHLDEAKKRLGFEELFSVSLASLMNKNQFETESGAHIEFDEKLIKEFVNSLHFDLTNSQRRVVWQIFKDLQSTKTMNRLVEGDVGSGKTVVAAMATLASVNSGFQVAVMAPTEILASQHLKSFKKLLGPIIGEERVVLLKSALKKAEKDQIKAKISSGKATVVVGTHALITGDVQFKGLGLVVVDEQHRFGVEQRKALMVKAGKLPHVLSMTATPIPRTLALTLYGELDISIIDEMPPGRLPVLTQLVSPNSKNQLYDKLRKELDAGRQMFVVCPLIEESAVLDVLSAEAVYADLSKKVFKEYRVALLHGRMKPAEKDEVMNQFSIGEIDVLVSTTVVEVGVDVPNATVMLIEGVERFGLAQVHQLRGRIGRGEHQGYCYLIMGDSAQPSRRLKALESTADGFKLAELDLEIRGPGAIYGQMQSGALDLKFANLSDAKLISLARNSAKEFLDSGDDVSKYSYLNVALKKYRSITNLN